MLKGTTKKLIVKKEDFSIFLNSQFSMPLISAGLPSVTIVLTPTAKSVLLPFGLTAAIKGISEIFQNEAEEQNSGFLPMLSGKLAPSLFGRALTGRGVIRACGGVNTVGENCLIL